MTTTVAPSDAIAQALFTLYSIESRREFLLSNSPRHHPQCGRDGKQVIKKSGVEVTQRIRLRNRCHRCRLENAIKYAVYESGWYIKTFYTPGKYDWEKAREREKYRLNKIGAVYQGFSMQQSQFHIAFVPVSSPEAVMDLQENEYSYLETESVEFAELIRSNSLPDGVKARKPVRRFGNYTLEMLIVSDSSGNTPELDASPPDDMPEGETDKIAEDEERQIVEAIDEERKKQPMTEQERLLINGAAWVTEKRRKWPMWLLKKVNELYGIPIINADGRFRGYYFPELEDAGRVLYLDAWEPYLEIQDKIDEIVNKLPYEAAVWAMSDEALELAELRRMAEEVMKELESEL